MNKKEFTADEAKRYESLTEEMRVQKDYIDDVLNDIINGTSFVGGMADIDQQDEYIQYCIGQIRYKYLEERDKILPNEYPKPEEV